MGGLIKSSFTALRHKLLPRSLFGRSLLIIALPLILLQLIAAFTFFDRHWDSMTDKLAFALAGEVDIIAERLAASKSQAETNEIIKQASRSLELLVSVERAKATVETPPGPVLMDSYWFSVGPKLHRMLSQKLHMPFIVRPVDKERWLMIEVAISQQQEAHFMFHERRILSSTTYIFIVWLIGSAFVLFSIAILFMRNQIRPIMKLAVAAEKLGKGQDVPDFRPVGATEVRKASEAFLKMKERLKRQMEQRASMLAGVSHDLRTPLTRMKLQMAMTKNNPEMDALRQDIDEMEKMIEGYLTFAKGEGSETTVMTDVASILKRIDDSAKRQGCAVQLTAPEKLQLRIRPMAIERAISNIVTNACKYAKNVWVNAYELSGAAEIVIDDDGPGIPADQRDEVFRPFYRLEKSRNKKTGGVGLGLSITQDIVHAHGGEVILEDSNRGGLRVVIRLPF